MKRREFITLIGGAAAWPPAARAQQPERMRHIGVLLFYAENDPEGSYYIARLLEGLRQSGWTPGHNIQIDYRWGGALKETSAPPMMCQSGAARGLMRQLLAGVMHHPDTLP
jgi:putative tryptophan/tyrosine transport system substrate-binding protein